MSDSRLTTNVRTFEIKVAISGWLEGTIADWPSHIQDGIYQALERKAKEVELPLTIVHSACDIAYDDEGNQTTAFLHVIASEIVARDMRFTDEQAMMKAFDEYLRSFEGTRH